MLWTENENIVRFGGVKMESTVLNVNNLKVGFWSDKELILCRTKTSAFPYSEEKL